MITRKIGAVLRGKATPFQLLAACVLGAMLGFAPGFVQAPALLVLLVAALLVVNANLGLALFAAGLAKLLALVAAPVSFRIGQFLLDGPTHDIARWVVNAPVLAWCGFEYYAVAGGQLLGLAVGTLAGLIVTRSVGALRRRLAAAQGNASRMQELARKPVARFALWLLLGGTGKQTWEQKLQKRVGNPVRLWGAALLVLLLGGAYAAQLSLAGPYARRALETRLAETHGATVDVGGVELDLRVGRFAVAGLAFADPDALERDAFRVAHLEADVVQTDLARRQLHMARVVVRDIETGAARETPGVRVGPAPVEPTGGEEPPTLYDPRDLSLEDVLEEVELWRERLTLARGWIETLAGDPGEEGEESEEPTGESLSDALEREAREQGWFTVRADHLLDEAPAFRLSELVLDGIAADFLPGRIFDLHATELSTDPSLVDAAPRAELVSRAGDVRFEVDLAPVSRAGGDGGLRFSWKGLAVDDTLAKLRLPGAAPLRGGTLDLELDGAWDAGVIGWVDLPLRVTFHDTTFLAPGMEPVSIEEFVFPIGIRGSIDSPRIRFEHSKFINALTEVAKRELASRLRARAEEELDVLAERAEAELDVLVERAGGELGGLVEKSGVKLPGSIGEALPDDVTKDVSEKLSGDTKRVLGGLLGRKP